jgi:hypothetical protein
MRLYHFIFYTIIVASIISSCKSNKDKPKEVMEPIIYKYEVGPCFGQCPVFSMEIDEKGFVYLDAKKYNRVNGLLERQLTKEEFSKVQKAFDKANLFKLQDSYPTDVADLPSIKVTHIKNNKSKTVKANEKMPQSYEDLLKVLNEMVSKEDWTIISKYEDEREEKKDDANIYGEIIVSFRPNTRLPHWFKENEVNTIRLLKAVNAETNTWLITYDITKFEPFAMLDKLKKDAAVVNAEFNKKISNR